MSTSLNVVSIAAVFCASLRRRRRSGAGASSARALRLRLAGDAARRARRGAARRGGGAAAAPRRLPAASSAAASTSSLVRRPSLPVPLILDGSTLMLEHRAAHRRRQGRRRCRPSSASSRLAWQRARPGAAASALGRRRCGRADRGRLPRARRRPRRAFVDPRDHRADRDRVAFLDELLAHHAGDRRRHLDRDLVGLEAGDRLVGLAPRRRAA